MKFYVLRHVFLVFTTVVMMVPASTGFWAQFIVPLLHGRQDQTDITSQSPLITSIVPIPDPTTVLSTQISTVDGSTTTVIQTITAAPPPETTSSFSYVVDTQSPSLTVSISIPTESEGSSSLSKGAKIGIGVGVSTGVLVIVIAGFIGVAIGRRIGKKSEQTRWEKAEPESQVVQKQPIPELSAVREPVELPAERVNSRAEMSE